MQKKTMEAEGEFKKALLENPDYLKSYYSLAKLYMINKEEEKAVSQYKKIIEKNPQQAASHMMLGTIYDLQKKFDLSENHYRKALEINPDFIPAANNLAYLLASQDKEIDAALGLAQKAKERQPDNPAIMDTLGWIYYKKGLYDAAIRELQGSVEKIPENASVRYHLGLAYNENGKKDLAKKEFAEALRINEKFEGSDNARKILSEL
jgi:tetratricopeptide (TPR) repeat protein